jgi:O-antigen/teichoic acid export membrane protein
MAAAWDESHNSRSSYLNPLSRILSIGIARGVARHGVREQGGVSSHGRHAAPRRSATAGAIALLHRGNEHNGQAWASVGRSAGLRILFLPLSAILGIVTTRLIIENYGAAAYAQYGLLIGLGLLLPFADLGMAAAVVNAVGESEDPAHDLRVRRTLITAFRVLAGSAAVVVLAAVVITRADWWNHLLGQGLVAGSGAWAAELCLITIGLTLLVAVGHQVLRGLGKNHVSIALLGLQTPLVLCALLVIVGLHLPIGAYVAVLPYAATFVLAAIALRLAAHDIHPTVGMAVKDAFRIRAVRGTKISDVAWPMLVQMIALPIAIQTDRLLLSHLSTVSDLASYNLAAQIFTPVWLVTSAAGMALWPIFAKARARGQSERQSARQMSVAFAVTAGCACLALAAASPWLSSIATGGQVHMSWWLVLAFSVFMTLQAAKFPLGMFMTDAAGLRFQALMSLVLLPLNLGLSIPLAIRWGAAGPVVGSALSVLVCQVIPNWIYVRRSAPASRELVAA